MEINLRQNKKGNWWANATVNGYDYSVEGETIVNAKYQIATTLNTDISLLKFTTPQIYTADDVVLNEVGFREFWIDRECRRN